MKLSLNFSFWSVLIMIPVSIILAVSFYIKDKRDSEIIDQKYAYHLDSSIGFKEVYIFKQKSTAIVAYDNFSRDKFLEYNFISNRDKRLVQNNYQVDIIKYVRKSSIARVRLFDQVEYGDTIYFYGWIPTNVLHDSTLGYGINKLFR